MKKPEVRRANLAEMKLFFGEDQPIPTGKFWGIFIDNEIVGVGGYTVQSEGCFVFTNLTPSAREYPMHILRCAKRIMKDFEQSGRREMLVIQDADEVTSERWITAFGFTQRPDGLWSKGV